jgi:two-component system response regulator AtoC
MGDLLLVEDADSLREALTAVLTEAGFSVVATSSAEEALQTAATRSFECILSDFKLPGADGIELAKRVRAVSSQLPFIIMTAYGSVDVAVEAMKAGVTDFITKPFEPQAVVAMLRQVIEHNQIVDRGYSPRKRVHHGLITRSPRLLRVVEQARRVASVDTPVLLLGESGSGKEVMARFIHEQGMRRQKPFMAVNCGAIPSELLESEFFGHEAGAFTGATQRRVGIFELAEDGTVFLDEVGEMPPHLQVKLLRALQQREIRRVGGSSHIPIHARLVTATNRAMQEALATGAMREDFYYRIAVVTIELPPLRDRTEDIPDLAQGMIAHFAALAKRKAPTLDPLSLDMLLAYRWPGNVRELENVIERAIVLAEDCIRPEHLGISVSIDFSAFEEATKTLSELAHEAVRDAEVEAINRALAATAGNKSRAAELLGVSYKTLLSKVKEYGLMRDGIEDLKDARPQRRI